MENQENRKRSGWKIALAVVVIALLLLLIIPYLSVRSADSSFDAGNYAEAVRQYESASWNPVFTKRAEEGIRASEYAQADIALQAKNYDEAIAVYEKYDDQEQVLVVRKAAAENAFSSGDYARAAEMYEALQEHQQAADAWRAYAEERVSAGDFQTAADTYDRLSEPDKVLETRLAWADHAFAEADYDTAAAQYELAGAPEKQREAIFAGTEQLILKEDAEGAKARISGITGSDAASAVYRGIQALLDQKPDLDADTVWGTYGAVLEDVDTQLDYCAMLRRNGLDLKKVYPEGVAVNTDLSSYWYDQKNQEESIDYSKILIFSRTEDPIPLVTEKSSSLDSLEQLAADRMQKVKKEPGHYHIRLLPGEMQDLFIDNQAGSWDECTALLLLDQGYDMDGYIYGRTSSRKDPYNLSALLNSSLSPSEEYTCYPRFEAFSAFTFFDKANRAGRVIFFSDEYLPPAHTIVVGNDFSDAGIDLSTLEIEKIKSALNEEESEEAQELLSQYSEDVIRFVKGADGWGDYILIPSVDENGNPKNFKATNSNASEWFTDRYMTGVPDETWFRRKMAEENIFSELCFWVLTGGKDDDSSPEVPAEEPKTALSEGLDTTTVLEDGRIQIENDRVSILIDPLDPWTFWGQDIWGQLGEYYSTFSNPLDLINQLILSDGSHLWAYHPDYGLSLYLYLSTDDEVLSYIKDLDRLDGEHLDSLIHVYQGILGPKNTTVSAWKPGDHTCFVFDIHDSEKDLRSYRFVIDGLVITVRLIGDYEGSALAPEWIASMDEMIQGLHFTRK